MQKNYLSFFVFLLIVFAVLDGMAVPIRAIGPVDVTGTVSDLNWVPEKTVKGVRGMSGSAGIDRIMPAHFLVTLRGFEGVDSQTAVRMTRYLNWAAFKDEGKDFVPPFIILKINHNDEQYLKKGMRIKVSGYTVRGDEGGTWTYYKKVDILNQPSQTDSIQRYLEASLESPNSGGKMFCAYELYGTDTMQNTRYIYLWATCMEYYVKDGALRQGVGVSLPVALIAEETPRGVAIKGYEKPVDGEGYSASIKKIFPSKYHSAIFAGTQEYNRRAEDLLRDTEKQARAYFHLKQ